MTDSMGHYLRSPLPFAKPLLNLPSSSSLRFLIFIRDPPSQLYQIPIDFISGHTPSIAIDLALHYFRILQISFANCYTLDLFDVVVDRQRVAGHSSQTTCVSRVFIYWAAAVRKISFGIFKAGCGCSSTVIEGCPNRTKATVNLMSTVAYIQDLHRP